MAPLQITKKLNNKEKKLSAVAESTVVGGSKSYPPGSRLGSRSDSQI